jgi:hypothetical protein
MFTALLAQNRIQPAEGILPTRFNHLKEFIMNAKEIKAALADEGVQAAVEKQVAAAVKAETKRVLAVVKEAELPEDKAAAKATKEVLKAITAGIKEAA